MSFVQFRKFFPQYWNLKKKVSLSNVGLLVCLVGVVTGGLFLPCQGEKNAGFDVLYHNMKHGQLATKELAEYIRER